MLKQIFLFAALFWTGIILFFCLENASNIPVINIPYLDKVTHAFFHFVLILLWFLFFKKKLNSSNLVKPLVYSFLFSFVLGLAIELMQQYFTTTRTADIFDVVANLSGATLAILLTLMVSKYFRILEKI